MTKRYEFSPSSRSLVYHCLTLVLQSRFVPLWQLDCSSCWRLLRHYYISTFTFLADRRFNLRGTIKLRNLLWMKRRRTRDQSQKSVAFRRGRRRAEGKILFSQAGLKHHDRMEQETPPDYKTPAEDEEPARKRPQVTQ